MWMAFLDRSSASHCLLVNDFDSELTSAASLQQLHESVLPVYCSVASGHPVDCLHAADMAHWVLSHSKYWANVMCILLPSHQDMLAAKPSANQSWHWYQTWHVTFALCWFSHRKVEGAAVVLLSSTRLPSGWLQSDSVGRFPAVLWQPKHFNSTHNVFLTLTKLCLCIDLTDPVAQLCDKRELENWT